MSEREAGAVPPSEPPSTNEAADQLRRYWREMRDAGILRGRDHKMMFQLLAVIEDLPLAVVPPSEREVLREALDGLDARESWQTRHALARRLNFETMDAIRGRSADCQTSIRHGTASQPVMDREALIRYIDWLVTRTALSAPRHSDSEGAE